MPKLVFIQPRGGRIHRLINVCAKVSSIEPILGGYNVRHTGELADWFQGFGTQKISTLGLRRVHLSIERYQHASIQSVYSAFLF